MQPGGDPGEPVGNLSRSWSGSAGKPQILNSARLQRDLLGDAGHVQPQAVVGGAADRDRHRDRDVDCRGDERHPRGFVDADRLHVVDGNRAEDVGRVAFVVGDDRHFADLRAGSAAVDREVGRAAFGDRSRVAEDPGRQIHGHVFDDLGRARVVEHDLRRQIRMCACFGVGGTDFEVGDRRARGRRGREHGRHGQGREENADRLPAHPHPLLGHLPLSHSGGSTCACGVSSSSSSRTCPCA